MEWLHKRAITDSLVVPVFVLHDGIDITISPVDGVIAFADKLSDELPHGVQSELRPSNVSLKEHV